MYNFNAPNELVDAFDDSYYSFFLLYIHIYTYTQTHRHTDTHIYI